MLFETLQVKFKPMQVEDKEIKQWIVTFQETNQGFDKILEALADLIYQFPAIAFEVYHHDIKGDFYLYVSERLEKILKSYQPLEKAKFKTFFYLTLRRHYFNFIKARKPKIEEVPLEEEILSAPEEKQRVKELEKISLLFASLPPKYQLILKLRCPDFLAPEDFLALGKEFNQKPSTFIQNIDVILEEAAKNHPQLALVSPRTIAHFLGVKASLVSKWLFNIKEMAQNQLGASYVF